MHRTGTCLCYNMNEDELNLTLTPELLGLTALVKLGEDNRPTLNYLLVFSNYWKTAVEFFDVYGMRAMKINKGLKGQKHEIFELSFFFMNRYFLGPRFTP